MRNTQSPKRRLPQRAQRLALPPQIEQLEGRMFLSTTWFVATNGSDSHTGTLSSPFRTIQEAAIKAQAGDTVMIRAGVYRETVTVPHSGTSSAPITFEPYNNESVTIDGANLITGWTKSTGSIYTASMATNLGNGNNQVFVDGKMINEARWPNTSLDLSHPVMATIGSTASVTSTSATIKDSHLTQRSGFWVGATLHIGAGQDWVYQTGTVTASGPGFVTFSYTEHSAQFQAPTAGNHYYLSSVANALDSAGEWFRSSSGKLSLWTPSSDNPANHTVEAKARQYSFDLSQASYIHLTGLHFFACSILTSSKSVSDVINHISAQYISHYSVAVNGFQPAQSGIVLAGQSDVLENSVIADSAGNGVYITGSFVTVTNTTIHDVDYAAFDAAPVQIAGFGDIISHNTFYNAGRDGMLFQGNHGTITNNLVYDYGLQTTDLGGFYVANHAGNGTVIAYNDFHDGFTGGFGGTGIMFDNNASGFIAHHNIVWHVNSALRIVGTKINLQIYNNTFDATKWGLDKGYGAEDWSHVIMENNIFTHPLEVGDSATVSHNISNNGKFVDAAHGNFALVSGAPAIDSGLVVPPYTNGYVGRAPDDGALEYGKAAFSYGA